jgi:hypothetical protein
MDRSYYILIIILSSIIFGCSGNKKTANSSIDSTTIHKLWKFDTVKSVSNNIGSVWIGRNLLDLSNHDTLRFSYKSNKAMPTSYPYKISHDTIFVSNRPAYKILKLTSNELHLYAIFNSGKSTSAKKDSIVMIYKAK